MTKQEADFIGSMNMCDEISNEAYKKIMCNCEVEEQQPCEGMRDATEEERKSTKDYIDSISKPTGLQFDDIYEELDFVQPHKKISVKLQLCEDCISRKDTIEWLKKVTVTDGITFKTGFEQILYDIEQMPSVTPNARWIPVSERLPEGYCLFCDIDGDVYYGHIYDKKWWAEGQNDIIKNVTAWMPLPSRYQGE